MKNKFHQISISLLILIGLSMSVSSGAASKAVAHETPKAAETKVKDDKSVDVSQSSLILPIKDKKLKVGWLNIDPYYSLVKSEGGLERLAGLDAELVKAITKAAGYQADYSFIEWGTQLQNLKVGAQHFAAAATATEERKKFVYFSNPYRKEENSFYTRKGFGYKYSFSSGNMKEFVASLKNNKSKIAVLEGMVFASPEINEFIADPANKAFLVPTKNVYESIDLLLRGVVDGVMDDRIVAATAVWRTKNTDKIEEVYLGIGAPIHLMFSKESTSPALVAEINNAIRQIKSDGTYSRVISEYLFPVLILQTIERPWFFFLEAFAIMALVISGLMIAYREKFNLYGTMMIAFVSMSGGIIRDVLVNRPKLGLMLSPIYAIGILSAVIIGFVLVWIYQLVFKRNVAPQVASEKKWHQKHGAKITDWLVELLDAFGLAAYTVTGVIVALISQLEPLWLWGPIMAVLTTTGGGIVRDVIRGQKDMPTLKSDFYGEIAIIWGLVLSLALTWNAEMMSPETMFNWTIFVVVGNFITRVIVKLTNFKGLPFNLKGLE